MKRKITSATETVQRKRKKAKMNAEDEENEITVVGGINENSCQHDHNQLAFCGVHECCRIITAHGQISSIRCRLDAEKATEEEAESRYILPPLSCLNHPSLLPTAARSPSAQY
ncbi:hypothetical protein E2C01_082318 [Portunus trituberculatus]|uniref:Uncharacterized protein n=1 Tax=Portunus trituberculatus TaxID=210409 RepID=A0A5B7J0I5_PORTR|nr:hypothetical protein [Portunus trituberculatus]